MQKTFKILLFTLKHRKNLHKTYDRKWVGFEFNYKITLKNKKFKYVIFYTKMIKYFYTTRPK
jgi:hypothetical protein